MSIKNFVGKTMNKSVSFMGGQVNIHKLPLSAVSEVQLAAKALSDSPDDDEAGLRMLHLVVQRGAEGGAELSWEEFRQLPLDESNKLATAIMEHSGLGKAPTVTAVGSPTA